MVSNSFRSALDIVSSQTMVDSSKPRGNGLYNSDAFSDSAERLLGGKSTSNQEAVMKKKSLSKGLSPPKNSPKKRDEDSADVEPDGEETGLFDKTQWERSRWGDRYSEYGTVSRTPRVTIRQKLSRLAEVKTSEEGFLAGAAVPGAARQIEQVRGEHLKKIPWSPVILLMIEAVLSAITIIVWGVAAMNPLLPFMVALLNAIIVLCLAITVLTVEMGRFQVKRQVADEEIHLKRHLQHVQKYSIPYKWRLLLFGCHVARAILICACITVMALDNDFDPGSIATLAMQPFHLIIVVLQIFIEIRPRRME